MLHRDVGTRNILLEGARAFLADFGLSRHISEAKTAVGTPSSFSPELIEGHGYGPANDVWGLGVALFTTLAHRQPFDAPSIIGITKAIADGRWDPDALDALAKSGAPEDLRAMASSRGMLHRDPAKRATLEGVLRVCPCAADVSPTMSVPNRRGAHDEPAQLARACDTSVHAKLAQSAETPAKQIRVLLVEDDEVQAMAVVFLCISRGYQAQSVESGEAALHLLGADPAAFDLVMIDANLGGMSGTELVRILRRKYDHQLAIIVISADADKDMHAIFIGADAFLAKPVTLGDISRLWQTVRRSKRESVASREVDEWQSRLSVLLDQAAPGLRYSDEQVDAHEWVRVLGCGSFAVVSLLHDQSSGKHLVAKQLSLIKLDERTTQFIIDEIRILAMLDHPHIVTIFGYHEALGKLTLLMEYAPAGSLHDTIEEAVEKGKPPPPVDDVRLWIGHIASALQHLHSHGVLHRDVSSRNVLLSAERKAVLADFGMLHTQAFEPSSVSRVATSVCGTPSCMSPELLLGQKYGAPSDIWALGVVMYELLTLQKPFSAPNTAALFTIILEACWMPSIDPLKALNASGAPSDLQKLASSTGMLNRVQTKRATLQDVLTVCPCLYHEVGGRD